MPPGPLIQLRQPVVRLGERWLQGRRAAQTLDRLGVALLLGQQHPQLEEAFRQARIECDGSSEQRFDPPELLAAERLGAAFPQGHGVVEVRQRVLRVRVDEAAETRRDLSVDLRRDTVHLAEELVWTGVGRRQVGGVTEGLHRVAVLALRIQRDAEADAQSRRSRVSWNRRTEHLGRRTGRAQLEQAVTPVEEVFLAGIHVRGPLILLGGGGQFSGTLLDVAEQVVQLADILAAQQPRHLGSGLVQLSGLEQRTRQVVANLVARGIERLGAPEVRQRRTDLAFLQVERGQHMASVEAVGMALHAIQQLAFERCEIGLGLARGRRRPRLGHDARRRGNDGEREDGDGKRQKGTIVTTSTPDVSGRRCQIVRATAACQNLTGAQEFRRKPMFSSDLLTSCPSSPAWRISQSR